MQQKSNTPTDDIKDSLIARRINTPPSERGTDMLMSQYLNSGNMQGFLGVLTEELQELTEAGLDTIEGRYLEKAYGKQLDYIAEIVGISRAIPGAASLGLFGFYDHNPSLGLSDQNVEDSLGGVLWGQDEDVSGDLILNDTELRNYIKARIIKNSRQPTVDNILEYIELLLNKPDIKIHLQRGYVPAEAPVNNPAYYNLYFDGVFNPQERGILLSLIKEFKPQGVTITLQDLSGDIELPSVTAIGASLYESFRISRLG